MSKDFVRKIVYFPASEEAIEQLQEEVVTLEMIRGTERTERIKVNMSSTIARLESLLTTARLGMKTEVKK